MGYFHHDEPRVRPATGRMLGLGGGKDDGLSHKVGDLSTQVDTSCVDACVQHIEVQQARLRQLLTEQLGENWASLEDSMASHMAALNARGTAASRALEERFDRFAQGLQDTVARLEESLGEKLSGMQVQFGAGLRSINDDSISHLEEIMMRGIQEQKASLAQTLREQSELAAAAAAPVQKEPERVHLPGGMGAHGEGARPARVGDCPSPLKSPEAHDACTRTPEGEHHHGLFVASSASYQSEDDLAQIPEHGKVAMLSPAPQRQRRPSLASWEHDWADAINVMKKHTFELSDLPRRAKSKTWELVLAKFGLLGTLLACLGITEPSRRGPLARLEHNLRYFFLTVILANAAFMVVTVNYEIQHPYPQKLPAWTENVEIAFLATYSMELLLKLTIHRLYFFVNQDAGWNWLDFSLVAYGLVEHVAMALYDAHQGGGITFLRVMRIFKVAKVMRVFRLVSSFRQMRLIFVCLMGSFHSLFWSIVFMSFIFYVFSLLLVQGVASFLASEHQSLADTPHTDLAVYFGSVEASMLSLYRAAMGGDDWSMFYEVLRDAGIYWTYLATYLFFIAFTQIAVLNIITGIFVESAMQKAAPSHFQQSLNLMREEAELAEELWDLVEGFDTNGDGYMDQNAFFRRGAGHPVNTYLRFLGVDDRDLQTFLETTGLIQEQGVRIQEFVQGVMKLKGSARNLDMQTSLFQLGLMRKEHSRTQTKVERLSRHLGMRKEEFSDDSR